MSLFDRRRYKPSWRERGDGPWRDVESDLVIAAAIVFGVVALLAIVAYL